MSYTNEDYTRPEIASKLIPSWRDKLMSFLRLSDFNKETPPRNGLYFTTHENGEMKDYMTYVDKKIHGIYREWYSEGQIKVYCNYENGELHGSYKEWNETGRLKVETIYMH